MNTLTHKQTPTNSQNDEGMMTVHIDGEYVGQGKLYVTDCYLFWKKKIWRKSEPEQELKLEYDVLTSYSYKNKEHSPYSLNCYIDDFEDQEHTSVIQFVTNDKSSINTLETAVEKIECDWKKWVKVNNEWVKQDSKNEEKTYKQKKTCKIFTYGCETEEHKPE